MIIKEIALNRTEDCKSPPPHAHPCLQPRRTLLPPPVQFGRAAVRRIARAILQKAQRTYIINWPPPRPNPTTPDGAHAAPPHTESCTTFGGDTAGSVAVAGASALPVSETSPGALQAVPMVSTQPPVSGRD